jgi:Spy/CpxP family protein refolding chaperone
VTWAAFKPWLIMALIFGVGMVAGGSLVVAFRPEAPHNPPAVQQFKAHWMTHLSHHLNLTPGQETQIAPIVADAVDQIQKLHNEEIDGLGHIMDEANEKMEKYLTADQQAKLKEMMKERPHEFSGHPHSWEGHHPPGPGPDGTFPHDGPQAPGPPPVTP